MDKHSFPNGKRLVRDTLKPDDNLHYEKFSDGTVKCIEDEIPFDVPEGWAWSKLGPLCEYITSGSRGWAQYYRNIIPIQEAFSLAWVISQGTHLSSEWIIFRE